MSKDDVKHKARLLKQSGAFDASRVVQESPTEQLRVLAQESRNETAFSAADSCEACRRAREERHDPEALCVQHFAAVLGF